MDPVGGALSDRVRRGASPAFSSRIPAKKNSYHSLRENSQDNCGDVLTASGTLSDGSSSALPTNAFSRSTPNHRHSMGNANSRHPSADPLYSGGGGPFPRPPSAANDAATAAAAAAVTAARTRIPRPSPSPSQPQPSPSGRQQLSFSDAYRMAEEEEAAAAQGSPSPAPRPWRSGSSASGGGTTSRFGKRSSTPVAGTSSGGGAISRSESRMERILSQSPLNFGGRRTARRLAEPAQEQPKQRPTTAASAGSAGSVPSISSAPAAPAAPSTPNVSGNPTVSGGDGGSSVADMRRIRYEEDQVRMEVVKSERNGLFTPKARGLPKPVASTSSGRDPRPRSSNSVRASASPSPSPGAGAPAIGPGGRQWGVRSRQSSVLKGVPEAARGADTSTGSLKAEPSGNGSPRIGSPKLGPPKVSSPKIGSSPRFGSPRIDSQRVVSSKISSPRIGSPRVVSPPMSPRIGSPNNESPMNRGLGWDTDADLDFTANDLMVSDSPPVKVRRAGTSSGTSSITNSERTGNGNNMSDSAIEMQQSEASPERQRNNKLDEIRQLEMEAELKFPIEAGKEPRKELQPTAAPEKDADVLKQNKQPGDLQQTKQQQDVQKPDDQKPGDQQGDQQDSKPDGKPDGKQYDKQDNKEDGRQNDQQQDSEQDDEQSLHDGNLPLERTNKKIDEIRAREMETLSKRALATARLDEIRERNAGFRVLDERLDINEDMEKSVILNSEGEQVPNTPVTIFRAASREAEPTASEEEPAKRTAGLVRKVSSSSSLSSTHSRNESHELLRTLARVTTQTSPPNGRDKSKEPSLQSVLKKPTKSGSTSLRGGGDPLCETDTLRPSVGFAGLRRKASGDSTAAKRSSVANSETDPTDRIEGEMKLFAPTENQSDRGSIRAPSPDDRATASEDGNREKMFANEATPRPLKISNPLVQATPRVTGAYVETPAPERIVKPQEADHKEERAKRQSLPSLISILRAGSSSSSASSDSSGGSATSASSAVSTSMKAPSVVRQRSRSVPRSERRPLYNSAKPPTAHDDLIALKRAQQQQLDDPTLDNFDELLATHAKRAESDGKEDGDAVTPERLRRMSDSVTASLLDIKRARDGIEGLEGRVAQNDVREVREKKKFKEREVRRMEVGDKEVKVEEVEREESKVVVRRRRPDEKKRSSEKPLEEEAHSEEKRASAETTYVRIALPQLQLYRRGRLTLLGIVLLLGTIWLAVESTMCGLYCRPETCGGGNGLVGGSASAPPCRWSPDDPSFGIALPVKLDQWISGGRGRVMATQAMDDMGDWAADVWDAATGTDIRLVDPTYFSFEEKRRHRRRLQKHGLVAPWTAPPEAQQRLEMWRRAREARERARAEEEGREETARGSTTNDERAGWW